MKALCIWTVALAALSVGCEGGELEAAEAPVASLRALSGTTPDGDLRLDAQGRLQIDEALYRLFDYVLTAEGEAEVETLARRVEQIALALLEDGEAAASASALFLRYVGYRAGVGELLRRWEAAPTAPGWAEVERAHEALLATLGPMPEAMIQDHRQGLARALEIREALQDAGADGQLRHVAMRAVISAWSPPEAPSLAAQLDGRRDPGAEIRRRALETERARWRAKLRRWMADPEAVALSPAERRRAEVWRAHHETLTAATALGEP